MERGIDTYGESKTTSLVGNCTKYVGIDPIRARIIPAVNATEGPVMMSVGWTIVIAPRVFSAVATWVGSIICPVVMVVDSPGARSPSWNNT